MNVARALLPGRGAQQSDELLGGLAHGAGKRRGRWVTTGCREAHQSRPVTFSSDPAREVFSVPCGRPCGVVANPCPRGVEFRDRGLELTQREAKPAH